MNFINLKKILQKTGISVFLGFILAISFCVAASDGVSAAPTMPCSVEIPRNSFPVRSQPSDQSNVIVTLSQGSILYPQGISGDWYQVPFKNGINGFVHKSYVTPKSVTSYVKVFPGAALRSGADKSYNTISLCSKNTEFIATEIEGDWCKGTLYGTSDVGYIAKNNLVYATQVLYKVGTVVVIDPGHGSKKTPNSPFDDGSIGPSGTKEKDITLKIANKLKEKLEAAGIGVIMTRNADVGVLTFDERAQIANDVDANLFISIHCNASDSSSANGTETYYSNVDELKKPIDEKLKDQRKTLGNEVQKNLVQQLGRANNGVKVSNFTVITKTKMPSVLIETAYISNPSEERLLTTDAFQNKAAQGIYAGIMAFIRG
ncbi:MAG: N-acetylmuramoyl-L-alanine amidase [Clostridiales bacterium]